MPTYASPARAFLPLALIPFIALPAPSLWAQEDQWDKHMKSAAKPIRAA